MAIDGNITLTSKTLSGTLLQSGPHNGDVTLPIQTLEASAVASATYSIPARTLEATGVNGTVAEGDADLPARTLSGAGYAGGAATGDITVPARTLTGIGNFGGDVTLPARTLDAAGVAGATAAGSLETPAKSLEGTLASQGTGTGSMTLPVMSVAGVMGGAPIGTAEITLKPLTLAGEMVSGNAGTASITIPMLTLDASTGVLANSGSASITLPVLQLSGALIYTLSSFTGIAVNTRSRAVTTYSGLSPNSIAVFNGVTLMATANGILALTGDTDHPSAAKISASFTLGKSDLDMAEFKRVLSGYVGYRADGDMELTLITDDHHEYVYTLTPRRVQDQQHASRSKFGRGVDGMYWQVKMANVNGCDFGVDYLRLETAATGRGA